MFNCSHFLSTSSVARVCAIPVSGGRPRVIADLTIEPGSYIASIDVSRDDELLLTRVVGVNIHKYRYDILAMRADGAEIRPLTKRVPEWRGSAAFSPDGKTIAFSDGNRLRLMNADGSGKRTVKSFDGVHGPPSSIAWSPAGDLLAYRSNQSVWVMKPDGSELRRIARQPDVLGLAWRRR